LVDYHVQNVAKYAPQDHVEVEAEFVYLEWLRPDQCG